MTKDDKDHTVPPGADDPATSEMPGAPSTPPEAGLVQGGERDVSDRPQGDPEVPELGATDKQSGQLPDKGTTGS
jgi:hypothetical protein